MTRFWKYTHYGWGWDIGPIFGWWFVWSKSEHRAGRLCVYISNDATPPDNNDVRGFFIVRG